MFTYSMERSVVFRRTDDEFGGFAGVLLVDGVGLSGGVGGSVVGLVAEVLAIASAGAVIGA